MVTLQVHPRRTMTFEDFCSEPGPAIALDGFVSGPTRWDHDRAHVSFNHHEGVDRFGTRSTCEQVNLALRTGLKHAVRRKDVFVHVNDCDPDVCISVWLLLNPDRADDPAVTGLVALEGMLDTTAGCFVFDDGLLDVLGWIVEPWAERRDRIDRADADEVRNVIAEVCTRIDAYLDGHAGRVCQGRDYEVLAKEGSVALVREHGPLARARMTADGIEAFVVDRGRVAGGNRAVTIGKTSPFVPIDLEAAYVTLNDLDGCVGVDCWGGGNTCGGSPRAAGTRLDLDEILRVVAGAAS